MKPGVRRSGHGTRQKLEVAERWHTVQFISAGVSRMMTIGKDLLTCRPMTLILDRFIV